MTELVSNYQEFLKEAKQTRWLVDGIIPLGHIVLVVAKAGAGKSFIAEQIAISVATEKEFIGKSVLGGDVLIVDQETPKDTLGNRLKRFINGCGEVVHGLEICSMENHLFSDGTMGKLLNKRKGVRLILLDSLLSLSHAWKINDNTDMSKVGNILKDIIHPEGTIVVVHHCGHRGNPSKPDNPFDSLVLGATAIDAFADTEFAIWNPNPDTEPISELGIRPRPKKASLNINDAFMIKLLEDEDSAHFIYIGEMSDKLSPAEEDCYNIFTQGSGPLYVRDVEDKLRGLYSQGEIRNVLKSLDVYRKLLQKYTEGHNKFKYALREASNDPCTKN